MTCDTREAFVADPGPLFSYRGNGLPAPDQWQSAIEAMTLEEWGSSFSAFVGTTAGQVFATDDSGANWSLIASGLAPISKGLHYALLNRAA